MPTLKEAGKVLICCPAPVKMFDESPPGYKIVNPSRDLPSSSVKWKSCRLTPRKKLPLPVVSARSVNIGPSVLLTGNFTPVPGSVFKMTPDAGEANGMEDSAVAMLELRALPISTMDWETP